MASNVPEVPSTKKYVLTLSDEQFDTIQQLFLHYEWDLEYKELLPTNPDQQSDIRERDPIDERIREGETQCEFCLCAPCVT